MPYGIKYSGLFDPINNTGGDSFAVIIQEKDYTGDPTEILLAGTPVIHEWQEDDPLKPIKGSTLKISIINNGLVSLDDFYSEDDSKYYVELYEQNSMTYHFKGFLVQDDCSEIQVDFAHEINLTATDNLGLLKEITLGQAAQNLATPSAVITASCTSPGGHTLYVNYAPTLPFVSGDKIYLYNGATLIYTYTVVRNEGWTPLLGWALKIVELLPIITIGTITGFQYYTPIPLNGYIALNELLYLCLASTNVITYTRVYSQLIPVGGSTGRWIEDTYLDGRTFLNGTQWDSCYDVLDKIMTRFKATLFQAKGEWHIVRWGELPLVDTMAGATLVGYQYLSNMQYINDVTLSDNFVYGDGTDIENGLLKSIIRPYQYTKETLKFTQLSDILCNYNLQNLGGLRTSYTSGSNTIYEYDMNCWDPYNPAHPETYFIRVTKDSTGTETERVAVVSTEVWDSQRSCKSQDIPVSKNDIIDWSFTFRTQNSEPGAGNVYFQCYLTDGTTTLHLDTSGVSGLPEGSWDATGGIRLTWPSGDNLNEWHSVSVKSLSVPFDGVINVFLAHPSSSPTAEVYFKDMSLVITNTTNGTNQITGQTHTDTQPVDIKNNSDIDIYMDDTRSPSISGTLFLESYTGPLRDKTTLWNYSVLGPTYEKTLGNLTTVELMFLRYLARTKYDGVLLGINKGGKRLTLLSVLTLNITNGNYRFIFGSLSLDYKNNIANATMWQMTDFEDLPVNNTNYYEFNYLYENN